MKKMISVLIALCLLLSACGSAPAAPTTPSSTVPASTAPAQTGTSPATTVPPTTQATVPPATTIPPATEAPTTAPVTVCHPITGEVISAPITQRPVAAVINNIRQAQPLHGVGQADILYEIVAEGGGSITRFLAVFTDLGAVEKLGSIRSARTYMIDLAKSFNAPLIHCGGSEHAYAEFKQSGWKHLDEIYNGKYFYRDQARIKAGYSREHTLFAHGDKLMQGLADLGISLDTKAPLDYGFQFTEDVALKGESAKQIEFTFYKNGKATVMNYDEASGTYHGQQKWRNSSGKFSTIKDLADANNNEVIPFRNVFVLRAKTTTDAEGYRMFAELTGEGEGYYACGGQIVPIKWHREKETDAFSYTLTDGTPVTLGVGKTYVGIIPNNSPLSYK